MSEQRCATVKELCHVTVAQVIERFHKPFFLRYGSGLTVPQRKALQSILQCRTEVMGGHRYRCECCQHTHFVYHSCNHSLCPKCGATDTQAWVEQRLDKLLPVPYFMVTPTLPAQLRSLCQKMPEVFYPLFFQCAAEAIKDILADPKHFGVKAGFFAVFQSWQQNLKLHPHIHFVVPGVGLTPKGKIKKVKDPNWLVRGSVIAARLQTLLLKKLSEKQLMQEEAIKLLWQIKWNTSVEAFGDGRNCVKYLGKYLRKGPISNARIISIDEHSVTFTVKNREKGQHTPITVPGVEFLKRYLSHVMPPQFHRIRYYGFCHSRAQKTYEHICRKLKTPKKSREQNKVPQPKSKSAISCPHCQKPMHWIGHNTRAPPQVRNIKWIWRPPQCPA